MSQSLIPKATIIIPVYNEGKHLSACLSSLCNQSIKNIEIIVVDDGSTDQSKNIAKNFPIILLEKNHAK